MNLDALSIDQLCVLKEKVTRELQLRRGALRRDLASLEHHITPAGRRGPKKGSKAKVKYLGPNGEKWTGRGRLPRWLQKLITAGHVLDEYAVH